MRMRFYVYSNWPLRFQHCRKISVITADSSTLDFGSGVKQPLMLLRITNGAAYAWQNTVGIISLSFDAVASCYIFDTQVWRRKVREKRDREQKIMLSKQMGYYCGGTQLCMRDYDALCHWRTGTLSENRLPSICEKALDFYSMRFRFQKTTLHNEYTHSHTYTDCVAASRVSLQLLLVMLMLLLKQPAYVTSGEFI